MRLGNEKMCDEILGKLRVNKVLNDFLRRGMILSFSKLLVGRMRL